MIDFLQVPRSSKNLYELEEFVVSGRSCVMVLAIDRTRLLKEEKKKKKERGEREK